MTSEVVVLGSTSLLTNQGGNEVANSRVRYFPYGTDRPGSGNPATDYRLTGQRNESTIGLYDYGARFYDPALGRFISADTVVPGAGNPQALNRYSYVLNNPLKYTDPTGHKYEGGYIPDEAREGKYRRNPLPNLDEPEPNRISHELHELARIKIN